MSLIKSTVLFLTSTNGSSSIIRRSMQSSADWFIKRDTCSQYLHFPYKSYYQGFSSTEDLPAFLLPQKIDSQFWTHVCNGFHQCLKIWQLAGRSLFLFRSSFNTWILCWYSKQGNLTAVFSLGAHSLEFHSHGISIVWNSLNHSPDSVISSELLTNLAIRQQDMVYINVKALDFSRVLYLYFWGCQTISVSRYIL